MTRRRASETRIDNAMRSIRCAIASASFRLNALMSLHLPLSYPPMEAASVDEIPEGEEWQYEPKWDGFRCIAFRDGDRVELQSKAGQPLGRYFPEVAAALRRSKAPQF